MTQFVFCLNRVGFHYLCAFPERDSSRLTAHPTLPCPYCPASYPDLAFFFYRFAHRIVKNNSGKKDIKRKEREKKQPTGNDAGFFVPFLYFL